MARNPDPARRRPPPCRLPPTDPQPTPWLIPFMFLRDIWKIVQYSALSRLNYKIARTLKYKALLRDGAWESDVLTSSSYRLRGNGRQSSGTQIHVVVFSHLFKLVPNYLLLKRPLHPFREPPIN